MPTRLHCEEPRRGEEAIQRAVHGALAVAGFVVYNALNGAPYLGHGISVSDVLHATFPSSARSTKTRERSIAIRP